MRIRDGKKSDPGSRINIPDPQHWIQQAEMVFTTNKKLWEQKLLEIHDYEAGTDRRYRGTEYSTEWSIYMVWYYVQNMYRCRLNLI